MAGEPKKKRRVVGKIVLGLLAVIAAVVVAVCILAAMLWGSLQRIMPYASQIESDASQLESALDAYDMETVYARLTSINDAVGAVASELDGTEWAVASALPVVGEDVQGARTLVTVAQDVLSSTAVPLSDVARGVSAAGLRVLGAGLADALTGGAAGALSSTSVHDIADALASADGALEVLRSSEASLTSDVQTLSAMGEFHVDELNEVRNQLLSVVEGLRDAISQVTPALESYASAKSAVSDAADTASQVANGIVTAASETAAGAADVAGQMLSDAADAVQDASSKAKDFVDGAKEVGSNVKDFADAVLDGITSK